MKRLSAVAACVCLAALAPLAGCSKPENAIVGRWQPSDKRQRPVEFFKDGTVTLGGEAGKYSFPDDHHLKLDGNEGPAVVMGFRLEGDKLFLTNDNARKSSPMELDRIK